MICLLIYSDDYRGWKVRKIFQKDDCFVLPKLNNGNYIMKLVKRYPVHPSTFVRFLLS